MTSWQAKGTQCSAMAPALTNVSSMGAATKGMNMMGLSTMGNPNIRISLMLNRAGTAATRARARRLRRRQPMKMAMTRHNRLPQPPMSTMVSKKVLV